MKILAALALVGCGGGSHTSDGAVADMASIDAPTEPVHFIGRFDAMNRFAWPGTQIATRFSGTAISAELSDTGANDWFEVAIDGARQPAFQLMAGDHMYSLATGLADGPHDLVLSRRTESFNGTTTFLGFSGATIIPTPKSTRLIEMIGDSITCGYGVLGANAQCSFSPATESEPDAWGRLTADALGATHVAISYSGIGMLRNSDGTTTNTMPMRYGRTIADDPNSEWDFSYTPDVIVINLGTNDFAMGDPGAAYVTAYTAFTAMLAAKFPAAKILAATSPMLDGTARTTLSGYLNQVPNVTVVEIAEQLNADGLGCDYHPNTITQHKMAVQLEAAIRSATGW